MAPKRNWQMIKTPVAASIVILAQSSGKGCTIFENTVTHGEIKKKKLDNSDITNPFQSPVISGHLKRTSAQFRLSLKE